MARESTIQVLYGSGATLAPTDLNDGEFAFAHGNDKLFIGSNGDNTAVWVGAEILDEDNMASDSDVALATQQSIKAYVDDTIAAFSSGVSSVEGLTGAVDIETAVGITHTAGSGILTISGVTATYTDLGVARFNSNKFTVTDGLVGIATGGIATINLEADAVDGTKIEDDAIDSEHIVDGAVDNVHLANSTFTLSDGGSPIESTQNISLGDTLTIKGTENEVSVVHTTDTITIGLPDDVTITGNLTVSGTVTTLDVNNVSIEDPLIELGKGNTGDALDLGFFAQYFSGGPRFAGLARNASVTDADGNAEFFLFTASTSKPGTTISDTPTIATLRAKITGGTYT